MPDLEVMVSRGHPEPVTLFTLREVDSVAMAKVRAKAALKSSRWQFQVTVHDCDRFEYRLSVKLDGDDADFAGVVAILVTAPRDTSIELETAGVS